MSPGANASRWIGRPVQHFVLALAAGGIISARAATDGQDPAGDVPHHQTRRHHRGHSLDDRVGALSRALDLDPKQQSELRKVLEGQREQVMKVWNDTSVPAAYRVAATRAISDKTADQIRELLTDEQKKKYNPPKQPREAAHGSSTASVEPWMSPAKAR
jgi:Spy/CpxP family protein refolding chaperone